MGYVVAYNKPYAGGFITEHYGRPARGFHAVQIEVNRGLYLDEAALVRKRGWTALVRDINRLVVELCSIPDSQFVERPLAAE